MTFIGYNEAKETPMALTRMLQVTSLITGSILLGCDRQEETPAPAPLQQAQPPAAARASTPENKARQLLDQISQHTQQGNWQEVEKAIQQIQPLKPSLSTDLQSEIENAISAYKASRAISEQGAPQR